MGLGCSIYAQRNEHIRVHQLRLSGPRNEHEERPVPGAGEEDRKHLAPCSPLQHHHLPALTYTSETCTKFNTADPIGRFLHEVLDDLHVPEEGGLGASGTRSEQMEGLPSSLDKLEERRESR
ncbi:hypothetical protein RB195_019824 [Necator americanus]|uniref:Uncharacterized protein n=1 Tax=Necator americanus TaxID=51031 RepID=A0ABR1CIR6_NECAM